jgi:hypothetical protein
MAFSLQHFQFNRGVTSSAAQGQGFTPVIHTYTSATDTRATIGGANYFPPFVDGDPEEIFTVDLLLIVASDGVSLVKFNSLDPVTLGTDLLVSGPSLSVAAPTIAVDANALIISANTIRSEIATASFPGIMDTNNQAFSGIKNFQDGASAFGQGLLANHINSDGPDPLPLGDDGITTQVHVVAPLFSDHGIIVGTNSLEHTLGDFRTNSNSFAWTGPFTADPTGLLTVKRFNTMVVATIDSIPSRAQSTPSGISAAAAIPLGYRPTGQITGICKVLDNVTLQVGAFNVFNTGNITITSTVGGNTFGGTGNVSTSSITATWITADV